MGEGKMGMGKKHDRMIEPQPYSPYTEEFIQNFLHGLHGDLGLVRLQDEEIMVERAHEQVAVILWRDLFFCQCKRFAKLS